MCAAIQLPFMGNQTDQFVALVLFGFAGTCPDGHMGWSDQSLSQRKSGAMQDKNLPGVGFVFRLNLHGFVKYRIKRRVFRRDCPDIKRLSPCF